MKFLWTIVLLWTATVSIGAQLFDGSCSNRERCGGNGKCVEGPVENSFWCRCDSGFGGDFCETECDWKCPDKEKCMFDARGRQTCHCQGIDCIGSLNASLLGQCDGNPCNNGRCIPFNNGFMCICHDGFGGSYCEEGRDHCLANKCYPGSKCINSADSYMCDCPPGRAGQFCERFDCSLPGICNHGSCIDSPYSDKGFECRCDKGFEGELCNMDKNECLVPDVCVNNGTCVNTPGEYRCDCPPGFTGKYCEQRLNMCKSYRCENGGRCLHTERQMPVCQCKEGFIGKHCEQSCPPGYGGPRCDIAISAGVCSRRGASCMHGGVCIRGFCTCPPDFVGNLCELKRTSLRRENTCKSDPCLNNATCIDVDARIEYFCNCAQGFEGEICERRQDFCAVNPCANGGKCNTTEDSFLCTCPSGFEGKQCERQETFSCDSKPCANGGECVTTKNTATCECQFGFAGPKCEERVAMGEPKENLIRKICEKRRCGLLAGNGVCDRECNQAACMFDGGDCSGGQNPFSQCPYATKCADVFANGVCNQECNNEKCLYDGMDCLPSIIRCPSKIRAHCATKFANGICDPECNSIGCGFDGGDCATNRTEVIILTDIRLKIQIDPLEFQSTGAQKLMDISSALRATVRVQRDDEGPLVFEWDGEQELGRIQMDVQELTDKKVISSRIRRSTYLNGIVLYLEVEEICQTECRFTTAQSVVDLISAGLAKTNGQMSLGLPITEAMVASPKKPSGWTRNKVILVAVVAFFTCGTVAAAVIVKTHEPERSRKRKMVTAPVWMPPMEPALEKNRRNQSNHSSQRSLLDTNTYYGGGAKRHRGEYEMEYGVHAQYQHVYPQTLANGYTGEFAAVVEPQEPIEVYLPPELIPMHVQAAGSGPITEDFTEESVNQVDSKYRRRVLHWLAGNTNGKAEDLITSEALMCIGAGAEVNARDSDENTPLMLAIRSRRVRLAVVLMRAGGDPTIFNKSERSGLHEAVVNKDPRMLSILLTDKRLVKEIDELDRNGMTALMHVARSDGIYQVEMAKMLLSKGAKIDADGSCRKDSEIYKGRTALHYAALVDNMPMVELLVGLNSNKDKQDEAGRTPLMLAAKEGHEKTVKYLVGKGASPSTVDAMEKNAAQIAQSSYHHEIAEWLRQMIVIRNKDRKESQRQHEQMIMTNGGLSKAHSRQTFKAVKRGASKKNSAPSVSSRESNHMTPPPSDGSFSTPSPHYFTTSSTPTALESSPEHGYYSEMTNVHPMWYSTPSPYPDPRYHPMPPNQPYNTTDQANNSFYC